MLSKNISFNHLLNCATLAVEGFVFAFTPVVSNQLDMTSYEYSVMSSESMNQLLNRLGTVLRGFCVN